MRGVLHDLAGSRRVLVAVAARLEAGAVCRGFGYAGEVNIREWMPVEVFPGVDLVLTGIGKANAAGAVARFLNPLRCGGVLNLGICGALPGEREAEIGTVLCATACVFADEGVETGEGFLDCATIGFPLGRFPGSAVPVEAQWVSILSGISGVRAEPIATVSTCSGTDEKAASVAARTGACAEAMEGAAAALVCHRLGVPFAEVRVVSNTTGERRRQRWEVGRAIEGIAEFMRIVAG